MRIKPRHVQDEAENRYFTVRILGQERLGQSYGERESAFRVKVNERVKAGKYQSLDQVRGEFPGSQLGVLGPVREFLKI